MRQSFKQSVKHIAWLFVRRVLNKNPGKLRQQYLMTEKQRAALFLREYYSDVSHFAANDARVLHIMPESAGRPELNFHGSNKDIRNRDEYFFAKNIPFHDLYFPRVEKRMIEIVKLFEKRFRLLSSYDYVIYDVPGCHPRIIRYLKKRCGRAKLIFRSHNAEFFHKLDWAKGNSGKPRMQYSYLKAAVRSWIGDKKILQNVDYVWPISTWDAFFYWNRLARHMNELKKVVYVPYFYPNRLSQYSLPQIQTKQNKIVCFGMVNQVSPMLEKSLNQLSDLLEKVDSDVVDRWQFLYTGVEPVNFRISDKLQPLGSLENPFDSLLDARAMIIPSELGRGFKTKILEAILCNAYVILPVQAYMRLPVEVMPYCIPLKDLTVQELEKALMKASQPFPEHFDLNDHLREVAYKRMSEIFRESLIST